MPRLLLPFARFIAKHPLLDPCRRVEVTVAMQRGHDGANWQIFSAGDKGVCALALSAFCTTCFVRSGKAARGTDRTAKKETDSARNEEEGRKDPITESGLRKAKAC
jgi:hypothetical protein